MSLNILSFKKMVFRGNIFFLFENVFDLYQIKVYIYMVSPGPGLILSLSIEVLFCWEQFWLYSN